MRSKGKMIRLLPQLVYFIVLAVVLGACSWEPIQGPVGEKRTDGYTLNSERKDLNEWVTKESESFQKSSPEQYTLTAMVDIHHESDVDRITYEILVNEVQIPMVNVIQSFTLHPNMMNQIDAAELINSNVGNTYETSLEPGEAPYGLSLSRSYVLNSETEINSQFSQSYVDMYIKISYGSDDQRTEDFLHIQAEPSPRTLEYLKSYAD